MREGIGRVTVSAEGNVTVVELTDKKILDEMNIAQIGEQINSLVVASDDPRLVLDFSSVGQMSSSALGMLIRLHKRIREKNGQLRLCGIQPAIFEVFVITRLNEVFQICRSRQEALASLA
ncbi:MAG: STAS domain-containing protein [Phycisphaerae bacterium]|jgi:anti-sigma B factor antagonist